MHRHLKLIASKKQADLTKDVLEGLKEITAVGGGQDLTTLLARPTQHGPLDSTQGRPQRGVQPAHFASSKEAVTAVAPVGKVAVNPPWFPVNVLLPLNPQIIFIAFALVISVSSAIKRHMSLKITQTSVRSRSYVACVFDVMVWLNISLLIGLMTASLALPRG